METQEQRGQPRSAEDVEALARVIDDQRREIEGLRDALRYRALIEQAKGVLIAVTGEDADGAFRRLVQRSQATNQKLTQVAAGIIAQAVEIPPAARPSAAGLFDDPDDGGREEQLIASALAVAADDLSKLAAATLTELGELGASAVLLLAAQSDGSLALLAAEGAGAEVFTGWERIPLNADVPVSDAAYSGDDVLLQDREARFNRYPGSRKVRGELEGFAAMRLVIGHRCVGVLGVGWLGPMEFDPSVRGRLRATARQLAPHVAQHARGTDGRALSETGPEPASDGAFRDVLDLIEQPVMLADPLLEQEAVMDLRVEHLSRAASEDLDATRGHRLLPFYPELATDGFLERARRVLSTGQPSTVEPDDAPGAGAGPSERLGSARIGRLGSMLVIAWQPSSTTSESDQVSER